MATPKKIDRPVLKRIGQYLSNAVIYGLIRLMLSLPYHFRVRMMGALVEHIIGPLSGYRTRARKNLGLIFPQMPHKERNIIASACLNNTGRTVIENYSSKEFLSRMKSNALVGEGMDALNEARAKGQPVLLVTGHFGNYEAARAALVSEGFDVGGLYRNMSNPYFNAHYVKTMEAFGGPVFAQGRRGTAGFVRHLKGGGQLVLLFDQNVNGAPVLDFMGKSAQTAVSAAELALRYNALLVPFYATRKEDGINFDTNIEAPIPHSDPITMTQALNDSLAKRVFENPEQWFWVHNRWRDL